MPFVEDRQRENERCAGQIHGVPVGGVNEMPSEDAKCRKRPHMIQGNPMISPRGPHIILPVSWPANRSAASSLEEHSKQSVKSCSELLRSWNPSMLKGLLNEQVTGMSADRKLVGAMVEAGVTRFVEFGGKMLGPMVNRIALNARTTSRASSRWSTPKRMQRKHSSDSQRIGGNGKNGIATGCNNYFPACMRATSTSLRRKNRTALLKRMSRFCCVVRNGASSITLTERSITPGQTI